MARPSLRPASERAAELGREASALRRSGQARAAVLRLREAVRLAPEHAGLVGNLGNALFALGERAEALALLERSCRLDPSSGVLAYNLGKAHLDVEDHERARTSLGRALALGGVEAPARVNLGRLAEIEGRLEEAAAHWTAAAAAAPALARPHYLLARVGRLSDRRPLEALAHGSASAAERVEAHFGLGHAFEHEGDTARAFEHFRAGNELKRGLLPAFDPTGHEAFVARLRRAFDAELFGRLASVETSELPLFLVGLPRSGTTLAESVLAAHPLVAARGERPEIDALARAERARGYPERPWTDAERRDAARSYLAALAAPDGTLRLTDKMPGNAVHLGLIALLFASARVVHCRRDERDTALSLYFQLFEGEALAFSYSPEHIARVARAHRMLREHWKTVLPLAQHELHYEALVQDFEGGARALVAFAGLEWDERCLTRGRGRVHTASAWRVRSPVDARSVGRWRLYERELAPLWSALAET